MNATKTKPLLASTAPAISPGMLRMLRVCLWLYIAYIVIVMGLAKPIAYPGIDYDKHWFAARAILEGKSVYFGGTLWMGFNYPQAAGLAFFWLGFFSCAAAEYVWKATLLSLCFGCWWMARRYFRPVPVPITITSTKLSAIRLIREGMARHWGLTTAFMTCTYFALTTCIYIGNIDALNGFLAVAMIAACLAGAPLAAGVFWGMLTLVKMIPLLLIVPILFWRQWGLIKGFLITMAVYFMVLVATGRVGQEWYFVREAIPMIPVWWRFLSMSPVAFVLRICGLRQYIENPHAFMLIMRCAETALFIIYLVMLRAMVRRRMDWLRGLEGALVFYPLFTPLLEYHHFVWILPVYFLQARRWVRGELAVRSALLLIIGWVALDSAYHLQDLLPKGKELLHFVALPGYLIVLAVTLWDLFRNAESGMTNKQQLTINK